MIIFIIQPSIDRYYAEHISIHILVNNSQVIYSKYPRLRPRYIEIFNINSLNIGVINSSRHIFPKMVYICCHKNNHGGKKFKELKIRWAEVLIYIVPKHRWFGHLYSTISSVYFLGVSWRYLFHMILWKAKTIRFSHWN